MFLKGGEGRREYYLKSASNCEDYIHSKKFPPEPRHWFSQISSLKKMLTDYNIHSKVHSSQTKEYLLVANVTILMMTFI